MTNIICRSKEINNLAPKTFAFFKQVEQQNNIY